MVTDKTTFVFGGLYQPYSMCTTSIFCPLRLMMQENCGLVILGWIKENKIMIAFLQLATTWFGWTLEQKLLKHHWEPCDHTDINYHCIFHWHMGKMCLVHKWETWETPSNRVWNLHSVTKAQAVQLEQPAPQYIHHTHVTQPTNSLDTPAHREAFCHMF